MRLSLLLACLFPSLAFAGLVEVNSSQYLRESGNPQAQYLEVTLDNAGEIRVSNVNLQDGYIELASSTDVLLNGSSLMHPFSLPTGGSAVFPLEAGTHYLEVTLRGKPGGGLKVSFYEDKPDAPERGMGWELLEDGTVLNRRTGLIFHRNMSTPGHGTNPTYACNEVSTGPFWSDCVITMDEYLDAMNGGLYGTDSLEGNAGYSDWRIPSARELRGVTAPKSAPPIEGLNGEEGINAVTYISGRYNYQYFGGIKPYEPFVFCWEDFFGEEDYAALGFDSCDDARDRVDRILTTDRAYWDAVVTQPTPLHQCLDVYDQYFNGPWGSCSTGDVWPVRGGTPE